MTSRLAALVLLAAPIIAFAADNPDDFSILTQKNIFVRDRQPPPDPSQWRPATTQQAPPAVPDSPAKSIVLRGVVIEDNELHAYVEDSRSGTATRLVTGDAIADGRVTDIALDAIEFEQNGVQQWINVGQNLYGATVAPPAPTTAPSATAGGPTTSPSADPALSSIEQRLRERRMRTQRNSK